MSILEEHHTSRPINGTVACNLVQVASPLICLELTYYVVLTSNVVTEIV